MSYFGFHVFFPWKILRNEQLFLLLTEEKKEHASGSMLCKNLFLVYLQNINQGVSFCWKKILDNQYIAIRRTRGDGNCFFRSFMFAYLEHILESQGHVEVLH